MNRITPFTRWSSDPIKRINRAEVEMASCAFLSRIFGWCPELGKKNERAFAIKIAAQNEVLRHGRKR